MTDVAVHPDKKRVGKFSSTIIRIYTNPPKKIEYYSWTTEYMNWFWTRVGVSLLLLGLPVAFIWLSVWTLMGYASLVAIPLAIHSGKQKTDSRDSTRKAYFYYSKLTGEWKNHGDIFYRQVWGHDCDGRARDSCYCYGDCDCSAIVACHRCDKRLLELRKLYESQKKIDDKTQDEISQTFFESSAEFRNSVEDFMHTRESDVMKEISNQVTLITEPSPGQKTRPRPLKERLRRGS